MTSYENYNLDYYEIIIKKANFDLRFWPEGSLFSNDLKKPVNLETRLDLLILFSGLMLSVSAEAIKLLSGGFLSFHEIW